MLGHLVGAVVVNVRDRDAELGRDVDGGDVVGADAVPAHHLQPRPGTEDGGRYALEAGQDALAVPTSSTSSSSSPVAACTSRAPILASTAASTLVSAQV